MNQVPLQRCSYGPYARAMIRICKEESFHQRQGYDIMIELAPRHAGAEADGAGCAEPLVVAVADDVRPVRRRVGPQRAVDALEDQAELNDELRQKFVDQTVPQAEYLGLTVPDPDLQVERGDAGTTISARSTGTSSTRCVAGNGPCNRERLRTRVKAWEDGAWVRDAAGRAMRRRRRPRGARPRRP